MTRAAFSLPGSFTNGIRQAAPGPLYGAGRWVPELARLPGTPGPCSDLQSILTCLKAMFKEAARAGPGTRGHQPSLRSPWRLPAPRPQAAGRSAGKDAPGLWLIHGPGMFASSPGAHSSETRSPTRCSLCQGWGAHVKFGTRRRSEAEITESGGDVPWLGYGGNTTGRACQNPQRCARQSLAFTVSRLHLANPD